MGSLPERLRHVPHLPWGEGKLMRRALLCLFLIFIMLISSLALPTRPCVIYANAQTEVDFTIEEVDVSAGGHTINLSLSLGVSVSVEGLMPLIPPMAFSGFGGDVKITVSQEAGSITLLYDDTLHSKGITTPLESTEISVANVPEGDLYVIMSPALSANITVEGPVSVEPSVLSWSSEGTQTVHIEHGPLLDDPMSMLAFGTLLLKIKLSYMLDVAVGARSGGSPVFERTVSIGALEGKPVVEASAWLVPIIPIVGGLILLAIVVAVVKRRRRGPTFYPEAERWVRCPRCGYEFPV